MDTTKTNELIVATDPISEVLAGHRTWHVEHASLQHPARGLALLPDKSVDHVICDPPYGFHVHDGNARTNKRGSGAERKMPLGFSHLSTWLRNRVAVQLARIVRRWIVIFTDEQNGHLWKEALEENGLEFIRWGTWVRVGSMPQVSGDRPGTGTEALIVAHGPERKRWNGGGRPALWEFGLAGKTEARLHTTQKPLDLMRALVADFTDRGDTVIDPFCGSGTTGAACVAAGRRFIGWERSKRYATVSVRRLSAVLEQLTIEEVAPVFIPPEPVPKPKQFGFDLEAGLPPSLLAASEAPGREETGAAAPAIEPPIKDSPLPVNGTQGSSAPRPSTGSDAVDGPRAKAPRGDKRLRVFRPDGSEIDTDELI